MCRKGALSTLSQLEARVWRNWSKLAGLAKSEPVAVQAIIALDPEDPGAAVLRQAFPECYLEAAGSEPAPSMDALRRIMSAIGDAQMREVEVDRVRDILIASIYHPCNPRPVY